MKLHIFLPNAQCVMQQIFCSKVSRKQSSMTAEWIYCIIVSRVKSRKRVNVPRAINAPSINKSVWSTVLGCWFYCCTFNVLDSTVPKKEQWAVFFRSSFCLVTLMCHLEMKAMILLKLLLAFIHRWTANACPRCFECFFLH